MTVFKPPVVVIPTYNELENIPQLLPRIAASVPGAHVVIADDNSPDGTADAAEEICRRYEGYRVYRRTGERGLGRTYTDAFQMLLREGYEVLVQMDADLSHNPDSLPGMLRAMSNADVVIGSRYTAGGWVENWPRRRVLLSRYANLYVRAVTGLPVRDATSGFRCWSAAALQRMDLAAMQARGYAFQVQMAYRAYSAGMRIVEVPITFTDRVHGVSKLSGTVFLESVWMPWHIRFGKERREP